MPEVQLQIKLKESYFTRLEFNQTTPPKNAKIRLKITPSYTMDVFRDRNEVEANINLSIESDDNNFLINVSMHTLIEFNAETLNDENMLGNLICNLMWPHIRSEVTLLSSQPGIMPIVLQLQTPVFKREDQSVFPTYVV